MTKIAENHIHITQELFNEGMDTIGNKNYKKSVTKFAFALIAISILLGIYIIYIHANPFYLIGELIFLTTIMVWVIFLLPRTNKRSKYKAMCQKSHGTPTRTVSFFSDHLVVTSSIQEDTSIAYKDIIDWKETKHLWILFCNEKMAVLLQKDGFTFGTVDIVKAAVNKAKA